MANEDVTRAVTCAIQTRPGMSMDELILCCRPYTWNQVFLTLDDLVRNGIVTLRHQGGLYLVSLNSSTTTGAGTKKRRPTARSSRPRPHAQV